MQGKKLTVVRESLATPVFSSQPGGSLLRTFIVRLVDYLLLAILVIGGLCVTISAGTLVARHWSSSTAEAFESEPRLLLGHSHDRRRRRGLRLLAANRRAKSVTARRALLIAVIAALALPLSAAAETTLHLPADIVAEATSPQGAVVTYEASATDPGGNPVSLTCAPESGATFSIGQTTVTCSTDGTEPVTGTFLVTVQDTTPPSLSGLSDQVAEAVDATGANIEYEQPTAADVVDGSVSTVCSPGSGSRFPLGDSTVQCTASDSRGNIATGSFEIHVSDTIPPTLSQPADLTVQATSTSGAIVQYPLPSATDAVDGSPVVTCEPGPGQFPIGTATVTCTAVDLSGNRSQAVTSRSPSHPHFRRLLHHHPHRRLRPRPTRHRRRSCRYRSRTLCAKRTGPAARWSTTRCSRPRTTSTAPCRFDALPRLALSLRSGTPALPAPPSTLMAIQLPRRSSCACVTQLLRG